MFSIFLLSKLEKGTRISVSFTDGFFFWVRTQLRLPNYSQSILVNDIWVGKEQVMMVTMRDDRANNFGGVIYNSQFKHFNYQ